MFDIKKVFNPCTVNEAKKYDGKEGWFADSIEILEYRVCHNRGNEFGQMKIDYKCAELPYRLLNDYYVLFRYFYPAPEKKYEILGEEQMEELVGKKIVFKSGKYAYLVTGYSKVLFPIIYTVNGEHDAESLLKNFTYLDGTPCGMEVE